MIPAEIMASFFAVSLLLALAPGPDNLFVLTQSALYGRTAGLAVVVGLCIGLVGHTMAVALGLAAVIAASPGLFAAIKFAGAGYLVYLAWGAFRARPETGESGSVPACGLGRLCRRGTIMNLTNPKVTVFFLAFLPQFVDPERGLFALQILLLGVVFMAATIVVFGSLAVIAGSLRERFVLTARVQVILNRIAGTVFLALAGKLFFSDL